MASGLVWPSRLRDGQCATLSGVTSSARARSAFLLLYGALLAWQIDRWFFTSHGIASTWAGRGDRRSASAGAPGGVVQTFTMGADGLNGVWLRATTDGRPPLGELVVDLSERRGVGAVRLERVAVPAADVVSSRAFKVTFREQRQSRGRMYELRLRHVRFDPGPALDLAITRDDLLADGRLFADGRERWGDLVFETSAGRATLPYWRHEVFRAWPAWVWSWPTIVLCVAVFNVVLAWACARATGFIETPDAEGTGECAGGVLDSNTAPDRVAVRRLAYTAATTVAGVGVLLALWPTPRDRTLDLIEALPDARIDTTWESVHGGVAFRFTNYLLDRRRTIHALPTTRLSWTIDVPRDAVFRAGASMRPDLYAAISDGIQMGVTVIDGDVRTPLTLLTLFPMLVAEHRRLVPIDLSLHPWAGRRITLELESTPERAGNAVNDVPVWAEPRITWPRRPSAGEARIVPSN